MPVRLPAVASAYSMRSGFPCQNAMVAAAGEVGQQVSGMPWSDFVASRIFCPLGMERSAPLPALAAWRDNVATPHHIVDGEVVVIESATVDHVGAAGCGPRGVSLVADAAGSGGRARRNPHPEREVVEAMFRPQAMVDRAGFCPSQQLTRPVTCGLGWLQRDCAGEAVEFHTGSIDGMVAIAGLIRDRDIGVAMHGEQDHVEVRHALVLHAFDLFLEREERDGGGALRETGSCRGPRTSVRGSPRSRPPGSPAPACRSRLRGTGPVSEARSGSQKPAGRSSPEYGPGLRGPPFRHLSGGLGKSGGGDAPRFASGCGRNPAELVFGKTRLSGMRRDTILNMRFKLASLRRGDRAGVGRWVAIGAFLFFLIKGLVWLGIFAAGAWSVMRLS